MVAFFIAFAIGQGFVGKQDSWTAIAIGGVTTTLFAAVSLPIFNRSFSLRTTQADIFLSEAHFS